MSIAIDSLYLFMSVESAINGVKTQLLEAHDEKLRSPRRFVER